MSILEPFLGLHRVVIAKNKIEKTDCLLNDFRRINNLPYEFRTYK